MRSKTVRLYAHSKLNLWIHLGKRGAEGLFTLESRLGFLALCDELRVSRRAGYGIVFRVEGDCGAGIARGESNLVMLALRAVERASGVRFSATVVLEKRIPRGAGLGGGSADAAAALRFAAGYLRGKGKRLSERVWRRITRGLGVDVAACWFDRRGGNSVMVSGWGERARIAPSLPPCRIVLLSGSPLATRAVYDAAHARRERSEGGREEGEEKEEKEEAVMSVSSPLWARLALVGTRNDLEGAAIALSPAIARRLRKLGRAEGVFFVRMSGSGSTCFGLVEEGKGLGEGAERLRALCEVDERVIVTRFLSRGPVFASRGKSAILERRGAGSRVLGCSQAVRQRVLVS